MKRKTYSTPALFVVEILAERHLAQSGPSANYMQDPSFVEEEANGTTKLIRNNPVDWDTLEE